METLAARLDSRVYTARAINELAGKGTKEMDSTYNLQMLENSFSFLSITIYQTEG